MPSKDTLEIRPVANLNASQKNREQDRHWNCPKGKKQHELPRVQHPHLAPAARREQHLGAVLCLYLLFFSSKIESLCDATRLTPREGDVPKGEKQRNKVCGRQV